MEYDAFISYSQVDDSPLAPKDPGWVTAMEETLRRRLSQRLGRPARVFRDLSMERNSILEAKLQDALARSRTLVAVVSPAYVASSWCTWELEQYRKLDPPRGTRSRIFRVTKEPTATLPDPLGATLDYPFYSTLRSGASQTHQPFLAKSHDAFYDAAILLGTELAQFLDSTPDPVRPRPRPPAEGPQIVLALPSSDMRGPLSGLAEELEHRGFEVRKIGVRGTTEPEVRAEVESQLQGAELFVMMVGSAYMQIPEGGTQSLGELQLDVAERAWKDRGVRRALWVPQTLVPSDRRQIRFIDSIREDPRRHAGADVIYGPLEELKNAIAQLRDAQAAAVALANEAPGQEDVKSVYLMSGPHDEQAEDRIRDYLRARDYDVMSYSHDESLSEQERSDAHKTYLRRCSAFLIHFGANREEWVWRQLDEAKRAPALGRKHPLRSKGVFVTPPVQRSKHVFDTKQARVIRSLKGVDVDLLAPFIADFDPRKPDGAA